MRHTIIDYMDSEVTTIRAGGPGSGRHPGMIERGLNLLYPEKKKAAPKKPVSPAEGFHDFRARGVAAGGPGSGRHPEDGPITSLVKMRGVMRQRGWQQMDTGNKNTWTYQHKDNPGHSVSISPSGWQHNVGGGSSGAGTNSDSLARRLDTYYK